MNNRWVVGTFLIGAAALVAVGFLWTPLGALLGGLILLGATSSALLVRVVRVRQNTAQVLTNRFGDRVTGLVTRPGARVLAPWQAQGDILDTGLQSIRLRVENVRQSEREPTTLGFDVVLDVRLVPETLTLDQLALILPRLSPHRLRELVEYCATYSLSRLIAEGSWHGFDARRHDRLERHLHLALQGQLQSYAVQVLACQVMVRPPEGLFEAMTGAEQQRVAIQLEQQRLGALLGTLAGQPDPARSLALLELARSLAAGGNKWVSLDLDAWLSQGPGQGSQTPGWSRQPPVQ